MNGGISKTRSRRPGVKPPKSLKETLLPAVASASAGAGLPQSPREQPPDALLPSMKRTLDTTFDIDQLPSKRARLARTERQQPGVEKTEQTDKPEPRRPKRLYASFLKDFVDPVHPYSHPKSLDTFVSEWVDSVRSREKLCRSDSHLYRSTVDPVSRQLTRSAPEMGYTKDTDGFTVPLTPAFTKPQSGPPSTGSRFSSVGGSGTANSSSGVRHRMYRQNNLQFNQIYIRRADTPLPSIISSSINNTLHAKRDSPEPSAEKTKKAMYWLETLAEGCDEDGVVAFLNSTVFPDPNIDQAYGLSTGLISNSGALMSQHLLPIDRTSWCRVTQPKPDRLYGYSGVSNRAFTEPQLRAHTILDQIPRDPAATSQGLRFPFFVIEFKAAGGTRGDLWVAANQCAGASAACLNAMDLLNESLRDYQRTERVDNLCYCIAMDNNTAHLYVAWKGDDLNYYLQRVNAFLLSRPEDFNSFRTQVRNILDWGKDTRLNQIRDALDIILEENRKRAAKSRPSPFVGSETSSGKKRKPSSSSRNSGRADSLQEHSQKAD